MSAKPNRDRMLILAFVLVLLVFGGLVARKYLVSTPEMPRQVSQPQAPTQLREVILYFASPEGPYLLPEAREIENCLDEEACLRATVQALLDGPLTELVPIFPSHAALQKVTVEGGVATVSFNRDLLSAHPGGSVSELLTVYGLVDTLAVNFPHIRQVLFQVEGKPLQTIKGHVDLREPVQADFQYTREPKAKGGSDVEGVVDPDALGELGR